MYVKISNKAKGSNQVHECTSVDITNDTNDLNEPVTNLRVEGIEDDRFFTLARNGTYEVYLMNEDGRTIDRYQLKP